MNTGYWFHRGFFIGQKSMLKVKVLICNCINIHHWSFSGIDTVNKKWHEFVYVCFMHVINCLCTLIQYCNFRTLNWRVFHSIWLIYFEETDPIVKSYLIFFNKKSEKVFRIFKINKVLNSIGMDFFEQMVFFFMRIAYICIYLNKPTPTTYSSTFLNEFFLFIFVSHLKNSWNCKWKKKCLSAHWN